SRTSWSKTPSPGFGSRSTWLRRHWSATDGLTTSWTRGHAGSSKNTWRGSNKGGDIHGHNDSIRENKRGTHASEVLPRNRFRVVPWALSGAGRRCRAACGGADCSTAGHGQLSSRTRGHGLRGLHGPDGRGRFRRASCPRLGLPGQGQFQGRGV